MYFKCRFKFCFGSINMSKNEHLYVKIEISLCFKTVIILYKWLFFSLFYLQPKARWGMQWIQLKLIKNRVVCSAELDRNRWFWFWWTGRIRTGDGDPSEARQGYSYTLLAHELKIRVWLPLIEIFFNVLNCSKKNYESNHITTLQLTCALNEWNM